MMYEQQNVKDAKGIVLLTLGKMEKFTQDTTPTSSLQSRTPDRIMHVIDCPEFELRQKTEMTIIKYSGINPDAWISKYAARFSELWDMGVRNVFRIMDALDDEYETLKAKLVSQSNLPARQWEAKHGKKFDNMWLNGDFGENTEDMTDQELQAAIFILYNK
jgi:hypothetical protein